MFSYLSNRICLNGHRLSITSDSSTPPTELFCSICGEKSIDQCPQCNYSIKPEFISEDADETERKENVPSHCVGCGNPFPWRLSKEKTTKTETIPEEQNPLKLVELICSRFHLVAKQLRLRYNSRETLKIEDEYDTQCLFHSLLHIFFDDIRSEEWTPSYAGSNSRIDFLLKKEQIIIEVKKTRNTLKEKLIGEQLIVDIRKYQTHPDCKKLICFVYDPDEYLPNAKGLENDLTQDNNDFTVKLIIIPKGH
jgi:hypothetical protein